jgi:hypothetical protein
LFVNAKGANFHLTSASPAISAGSATAGWYEATDFDGVTRDLPPDIGAYEYEAGRLSPVAQAPDSLGAGSAPGHPAAAAAKSLDTPALVELLFGHAGAHRQPAFASLDLGGTED